MVKHTDAASFQAERLSCLSGTPSSPQKPQVDAVIALPILFSGRFPFNWIQILEEIKGQWGHMEFQSGAITLELRGI